MEMFLTTLELKLKFVDGIRKDGCRQLPRLRITLRDDRGAKGITLTCCDGVHCLVELEFHRTDHDIKVACRWPACFSQGKASLVDSGYGSPFSVLRYEPNAHLVERFPVQGDSTANGKLWLSRL